MSDYEKQIWDRLRLYISNEYGIAGLMGNLKAESGLIPYRLQGDYESGYPESIAYTNNVNNGTISENTFVNDSKGYGLAQWTYFTRKRKLYEFISVASVSIGSLDRQIPYLIQELQNDYPSVWNILNTATSIRIASDAVLHDFENPKVQTEDVEIQRYNLSLAIWQNQHGSEPQPPEPPDPPPIPPTPTPKGSIPSWLIYCAKRKYKI